MVAIERAAPAYRMREWFGLDEGSVEVVGTDGLAAHSLDLYLHYPTGDWLLVEYAIQSRIGEPRRFTTAKAAIEEARFWAELAMEELLA